MFVLDVGDLYDQTDVGLGLLASNILDAGSYILLGVIVEANISKWIGYPPLDAARMVN